MANYSYNVLLQIGKDLNGEATYQIPFTPIGTATALGANTESHITVPDGVNCVFFAFGTGTDVWVDGSATLAAIPSGSTTADLNPVARPVYPGQTLSYYCGTASIVKASFYNLSRAGNTTFQS